MFGTAEYRSNGLGFRIGWHYDADANGTVDSSDPWYFFCYDEAWRVVATFRASDTYPKERFIPHLAGLGGQGGSSYIDSVLMRDSDSAAWTAAGSSTLSIRLYYCQNWRGDVSLIVKASGAPVEWVKYAAYGEPFCIKAGDANSDGNCTGTGSGTDYATIQGWITASTYDVRGDLNGDGAVNSTDLALFTTETLGRGILSGSGTANRIGYAGYQWDPNTTKYLARFRWYDQRQGRWMNRDPIGYADGTNLYDYVEDAPMEWLDPSGLIAAEGGGCEGDCIEYAIWAGEPGDPDPTIRPGVAPPWGPGPKKEPTWIRCQDKCLFTYKVWKNNCQKCKAGGVFRVLSIATCLGAAQKANEACLAGCILCSDTCSNPATVMWAGMCIALATCKSSGSCSGAGGPGSMHPPKTPGGPFTGTTPGDLGVIPVILVGPPLDCPPPMLSVSSVPDPESLSSANIATSEDMISANSRQW